MMLHKYREYNISRVSRDAVGLLLANPITSLFGITTMQVYMYYQHASKDLKLLKVLVRSVLAFMP